MASPITKQDGSRTGPAREGLGGCARVRDPRGTRSTRPAFVPEP